MISSPYTHIATRLQTGGRVVLDGATGTEAERLGAPMAEGTWSGDVVRTHPDVVRQVHANHIMAGAEVVITNTFGTSRHLLEEAGLAQHFETTNRMAVEVALAARAETGAPNVAVAGALATSRQHFPFPPLETARENYRVQAEILAEAGVDFFVLEMMRDLDHTRVCAEGALATGLPVWCGWSCEGDADGEPMLFERNHTLAAGLEAVADLTFDAMLIMHTEVDEVDAALDVIARSWDGPTGVYAHSGRFEHPNWIFDGVITAPEYTAWARRWVERGVQIIGGCCGITCDHIADLRPIVATT